MSDNDQKTTNQQDPQEPQIEEVKEVENTETSDVEESEAIEESAQELPEETTEVVEEKGANAPKPRIAEFRPGDTIKVYYKIIEGDKMRIQPFEGIVISYKGSDVSKTFTVRRIGADGIGVERIFPLYSPNIEKVDLIKSGKVRRAKLYYLREKKGREAMRIKERKAK